MTRPALAVLASLALAAGAAGAAHAAAPKVFLKKALEGDNSEITLGRLAVERGASKEARDYGRTLVEDHAAARRQAAPVAERDGVRVGENAIMPAARREARRLERLSGPAFDREFARYMVKDHRHDIDDFERQAATGDPDTAALARQTLPVLHKHLEMAEALAGGRS